MQHYRDSNSAYYFLRLFQSKKYYYYRCNSCHAITYTYYPRCLHLLDDFDSDYSEYKILSFLPVQKHVYVTHRILSFLSKEFLGSHTFKNVTCFNSFKKGAPSVKNLFSIILYLLSEAFICTLSDSSVLHTFDYNSLVSNDFNLFSLLLYFISRNSSVSVFNLYEQRVGLNSSNCFFKTRGRLYGRETTVRSGYQHFSRCPNLLETAISLPKKT